MAKKRVKLALIGCGGHMRSAHLPRLLRDGACDIVGMADPVHENAVRIAEKTGGDPLIVTDWRKLLDLELDGVIIGTPHDQHFRQAKAFLSSGRDVLVEKPLTPKPSEAKALLDLARQKRRKLVVAYQRHWQPGFMFARELIRRGDIGRVRGVSIYVTQHWGAAGGWRLDPKQSGGGMFIDTGSHVVAAMLWLTGLAPREVSAFSDNDGRPVDINLSAGIRFDGGALGSVDTLGNASRHDERIAIHGSKASLVLDAHQWQHGPLVLDGVPVAIPARFKESTPDEAFANYLRGAKGYERPDFALQVARLSAAVYKAARTARIVRIR